jgi:hypothetical protein
MGYARTDESVHDTANQRRKAEEIGDGGRIDELVLQCIIGRAFKQKMIAKGSD